MPVRGRAHDAGEPITGEGRTRAIVDSVTPQVDAGRFPVKRIVGDRMVVEAVAFTDGHDALRCVLLHRRRGNGAWSESEMTPLVSDRWTGEFPLDESGAHVYTVEAWTDPWLTWLRDLRKRADAGQDVRPELEVGARLVEAAAERAVRDADRALLVARCESLRLLGAEPGAEASSLEAVLDAPLRSAMLRYPDRRWATRFPTDLEVVAQRGRAAFSAWYEFFPRSTAEGAGAHGSLRDAEHMVEYVAEMGFDVVYLPPIHPIGTTHRKGRNNRPRGGEGDPGSPWAIGGEEGGHTEIHPDLGSMEDFRRFRDRVRKAGMEVALDIAFQCSPDHPWVTEHPEWFRRRPDGSIRCAENPPKKYEDIYPLDFESEDWRAMWVALRDVFLFWIGEGVEIFRVDNPHTKAFPFWEWVTADLRGRHPDVLLLSEAFTRPALMNRLAKLGFDQSYTYFTWRNTKHELTEYMTQLTRTEVSEFLRPNLWPNTPDILHEYLQTGGAPAFKIRAVLASMLSSNWGIYGPAYELRARDPVEVGSEEYADSEKYQIRDWNLADPGSLKPFLTRLNRIRRGHRALQRTRWLTFHDTDNESVLAFSKRPPPWEDRAATESATEEGERCAPNTILVVVNLDPRNVQTAWVDLDLEALGLDSNVGSFQVLDLMGGERFLCRQRTYVRLDPNVLPAHILRIERRIRSERDFDYFL